jgi:hypothetical protein
MGIKGSATCVMNFDGAKGWLIGDENKGLNAMFTMMNYERVAVGIQGLGVAENSYQNAVTYANDRLQSRAPTGKQFPEKTADPIIVHPDVRRMLLTQKAFSEGGRALIYYTAQLIDQVSAGGEAGKEADELLGLLTPIVKAFLTEAGFEATNEGVQIFGGHGFIHEWGMEQFVRDSRITLLYEGTTGIQALDLLGRKILMNQGETLRKFTKQIHKFCQAEEGNADMDKFTAPLLAANKEWGEITMQIGMKAMQNRDEVGAASVDYLMYSGYVTLGYFWAMAAKKAQDALANGTTEEAFYKGKLATAQFYFSKLLPRTRTLAATIAEGGDSLMAMEDDQFGAGFEI